MKTSHEEDLIQGLLVSFHLSVSSKESEIKGNKEYNCTIQHLYNCIIVQMVQLCASPYGTNINKRMISVTLCGYGSRNTTIFAILLDVSATFFGQY
jgi:hypothetical protein